MTRKELKQQYDECLKAVPVKSFYMRVVDGNITSQIHDRIENFWYIMDDQAVDSLGNVNFDEIYFYSPCNINAYIKNPEWNALDYDTYDSHYHRNIPYIDASGNFKDLF